MPSDEPSRPYNWRPKSLAKLEIRIAERKYIIAHIYIWRKVLRI